MTPLHATVQEKSPELIALDAEIKENVLKGLAFLKKTYGEDWVEHIDMEVLDLRSGSACVLGQVHPHYYPSEYEDGYNAATDMFLKGNEGREFGFSAPLSAHYTMYDNEWDLLQKAWEEVIPQEQSSYKRKKAAGLV